MVRGGNVDLTRVEAVLRAHPLVTEAIAVHDSVIEAYVATEPAALTADDVTTWCAERLAEFKQPHRVHVLPALPRTSSGELVRNPRVLADAR